MFWAVRASQTGVLFKKTNAQDLEDFVQASVDGEFLAKDGHQNINADGDPHLGLHGVRRCVEERLDS